MICIVWRPTTLGNFFLDKAALIITIVAVIKLCCNLSLLDNGSERKVRDNRTQATKTKQKKNHKQTNTNACPWPVVVKRWNKLRLSRLSTHPRLSLRLQQEVAKGQCTVGIYAIAVASSTCFRFFILQVDTSCWLPINCNDMTCSSSRTWA